MGVLVRSVHTTAKCDPVGIDTDFAPQFNPPFVANLTDIGRRGSSPLVIDLLVSIKSCSGH